MFKSEAEDLVAVLGYVSAGIAAGQPLPQAMQALAERATGREKAKLAALSRDLASGETLSTALARHWPGAAPFTLALVRAGEQSSHLAEALSTLQDYHQTSRRLNQRMLSSTLYPRIVLFMAIAIVLPLMAWCNASLNDAVGTLNYRPTPTIFEMLKNGQVVQILFEIPRIIFLPYQFGFPAWLAITASAFVLLLRPVGPAVRWTSHLAQRLFLVGPTLRNTTAAQFASALGLLIRAGIPMDRAVALISDFTGSPVDREALERVVGQLARGVPLSDAVGGCPVLPASLSWMIALGERGGNLEHCLAEAGRYYRGETEYMLDLLNQSIEPVLLSLCAIVLAPAMMTSFNQLLRAINNVG